MIFIGANLNGFESTLVLSDSLLEWIRGYLTVE